jgi:hypothetical protein
VKIYPRGLIAFVVFAGAVAIALRYPLGGAIVAGSYLAVEAAMLLGILGWRGGRSRR